MLMAAMAASAQIKLSADNIDDIISEMTLEEKAHLAVGSSLQDQESRAVVGHIRKIVPGAAGTTYPIERLGIPAIVLADGPAGLRIDARRSGSDKTYFCTGFPIGIALASTWNEQIIELVGKDMGNEVLEYGVDIILGPGVNLMRNPLCGRNFEYYSEDPLLSGKSAAAMIRGIQSNGVGTSMKHFAVNNQEVNRLGNDARVDIRTLRELYLRNFQIAVQEAQPWTIMTSYNYINGRYTSEDKGLLGNILRDEWGFAGAVMSDWGGGLDAAAQIKAGNDMIQPGSTRRFEQIVSAVRNGTLAESELDACVRRILQLIVRTPRFAGYRYSDAPDLSAHAATTRTAACEGMVLLKNDKRALPIDTAQTVALFGTTSYKFIAGGTGSGDVHKAYVVDLRTGMKNCGFKLDAATDSAYTTHMESENTRLKPINDARPWWIARIVENQIDNPEQIALSAAKNADAAIITIGRNSGEGYDRHVEDDYMLCQQELRLIDAVSREFHREGKTVTVILNVCGIVDVASWRDKVDAVLLCWLPGQEGGNSVADVVSGKVSPSGHLPASIPMSYDDVSAQTFPKDVYEEKRNASFYHFSETQKWYDMPNIDYTNYYEGIFVGYRHFASNGIETAYPFGYGLTYTTFEIDRMKQRIDNDSLIVTCRIRNTGDRAAKQVVQLYSSQPAAKIEKPALELRGWVKTEELEAGESQILTIRTPLSYFAYYDEQASQWVVDADTYTLHLGFSSEQLPLSAKVKIRNGMKQPTADVMRPSDGKTYIEEQ